MPPASSGRTLCAMQGQGLGRVALAVMAFGLTVSAVVVATEGSTFPGRPAQTAALVPTAALDCTAAGPYRAPDPDSVGVPADLALCPSGPVTVTTPGAVLDGWDVRGGIVVDAPDVVLRRLRVTGDGTAPYGIWTTGAGSVRIEDVTVTGDFSGAGIGGDHWTAERIEITRATGDGARLGSSATLRNSLLHDFAPREGVEADALVLLGPAEGALVEDNRIDMGSGPGHRSAVAVGTGGGSAPAGTAAQIRGNLLGGGEYTLRQDGEEGSAVPVEIVGNRFRRDAALGPLQVPVTTLLTDNTFEDGGAVTVR